MKFRSMKNQTVLLWEEILLYQQHLTEWGSKHFTTTLQFNEIPSDVFHRETLMCFQFNLEMHTKPLRLNF